jgi:hypothetical protein
LTLQNGQNLDGPLRRGLIMIWFCTRGHHFSFGDFSGQTNGGITLCETPVQQTTTHELKQKPKYERRPAAEAK